MSDNTRTNLFLFLVIFWGVLTAFSNVFENQYVLVKTDLSELTPDSINTKEQETGIQKALSGIFNVLDDIPFIKAFIPLFRMMSFQYGEFPAIITIILDLFAIISGFIVLTIIRGN